MRPKDVVVVRPGRSIPDWWHASVLLAGPATGRGPMLPWQNDAVAALRRQWSAPGRLVIFVPQVPAADYSRVDETAWLDTRAAHADVILFWLAADARPQSRSVSHILWGSSETTGRVVLGVPGNGQHETYLKGRAERRGIPLASTLEESVHNALVMVGNGARREGSHRDIPLPLWRTASFRHWLASVETAGHTLEGAEVAWSVRPSPSAGVFLWAVKPRITVRGEDRVKENEFVLGRTDSVCVVAYRPHDDPGKTEVVLVREFRSPAVTGDGYVHELPGGSHPGSASPVEAAQAELAEETGLRVDVGRLRRHGVRQPVGALTAHRQHLFSVELTEEELDGVRTPGRTFGLAADGERTTVEVRPYGEILADELVDWTTLGQIAAIVNEPR
ncbi:NUDIX domain-containing protein [Hamadaea tsunoensis]|uniref:NUDIX domain-containing protein n=1 Tax=Hamadaea tsunoensis TaxID=53368 RepID=UPI00040B89C6|nr:NUDIX domain-containing protein [Hamadaea tsunoensis]